MEPEFDSDDNLAVNLDIFDDGPDLSDMSDIDSWCEIKNPVSHSSISESMRGKNHRRGNIFFSLTFFSSFFLSLFFSFSFYLCYAMLSLKLLNQTKAAVLRNTRPAFTSLFRSQYHTFHEDNASVLPNLVEPASASFKVNRGVLPYNLYFTNE